MSFYLGERAFRHFHMEPGLAIIRLVSRLEPRRTRKELIIRQRQQQAGKDLDSDYGHEDDLGGVLKHGSCVSSKTCNHAFGVIAIRVKVQLTGPRW